MNLFIRIEDKMSKKTHNSSVRQAFIMQKTHPSMARFLLNVDLV